MGTTFRAAGLPITVRIDALLMAVVLGFLFEDPLHELMWVLLAPSSVVLAELGHALVLRTYRASGASVLWAGGAHLVVDDLPPRSEVAVHLAGPAVGLVLGLPLLALEARSVAAGAGADVLHVAVIALVGWAALSALPVLPFDGGRAVAALVGARRAAGVSVLAGASLTGAAVALGGSYAAAAAVFGGAVAAWNLASLLGAVCVPATTTPALVAPRASTVSTGVQAADVAALTDAVTALRLSLGTEALARLEELGDAATSAGVARFATELEGWAALEIGDLGAVRRATDRLPERDPARRALTVARELSSGDGGAVEAVADVLERGDLPRESSRLLMQVVAREGAAVYVATALLTRGALEAALAMGPDLRALGRTHNAAQIEAMILGGDGPD